MAGEIFHAPFIDANPNLYLKKIVERHSEKSKLKYPYVRVVKSPEDIFADKEIDLIVIATPNSSHYSLAKTALSEGKHVVVEKPFTVNLCEANELAGLAALKNKILCVHQNRRWDGDFLTVKKIIQNGYLGQVVEYESHFDKFRNYFKQNAWREAPLPGSGILFDLAPHLIDQSLLLFGLPDKIFADIRTQRTGGKVDVSFELILYYENLKVTLKSGMLVREKCPRFIVHGTRGSFVKYGMDPQEEDLKKGLSPFAVDWGEDSPDNWGNLKGELGGKIVSKKIKTERGRYQRFYEDVFHSISNNSEPEINLCEAVNIMRIIEAAIKSSAEERIIRLEYHS